MIASRKGQCLPPSALMLVLLLAMAPTAVADESTDAVDVIFAKFGKSDSPGCAVAIARDGKVLYKQGYGMASLEYDVPITPSTIFHVASVSKQFTAFAIAMLAAEGKLSLEDDIRLHLPELHDFGPKITVRHLANHTSGLRDQWELLMMSGWRLDDVITEEDILGLVFRQRELNFPPGDQYLYSNSGYTLMAKIVERVSGQTLPEFCQERMFEPLGMTNTHFHDDHTRVVKNRAYSYRPAAGGGFQKSVLSYANVGATSLFTTVEDLVRWNANLDDPKVGGQAVVDTMHVRGVLNDQETISYALGLSVGEYKALPTVSHSGGDAGFRSHLVRFPKQKLTVAVLSNLANASPTALALRAAEVYLKADLPDESSESEAASEPADAEFIELPKAELVAKAGLYLDPTSGTIWRVSAGIGKLGIFYGGQTFPVAPVAPNRFRSTNPRLGLTVEFDKAGDQRAEEASISFSASSPPTVCRRVEAYQPTVEALGDFIGEYYSDELDVTYRIRLDEGKLKLRPRRHEEETLRPATDDHFSGSRQIHFLRDSEGRVSGLEITGGRVRNVRFTKQMEDSAVAQSAAGG